MGGGIDVGVGAAGDTPGTIVGSAGVAVEASAGFPVAGLTDGVGAGADTLGAIAQSTEAVGEA